MPSTTPAQSAAVSTTAATLAALQPTPSTCTAISSLPIRTIWLALACELVELGCVEPCRALLPALDRHIAAFRDTAARVQFQLLSSRIASLEGQHRVARVCVSEAWQGEAASEAHVWTQLVSRAVECIQQHGEDEAQQPILMQQQQLLNDAIQLFTGQ